MTDIIWRAYNVQSLRLVCLKVNQKSTVRGITQFAIPGAVILFVSMTGSNDFFQSPDASQT